MLLLFAFCSNIKSLCGALSFFSYNFFMQLLLSLERMSRVKSGQCLCKLLKETFDLYIWQRPLQSWQTNVKDSI
jgi:hypothetical protein